ncbi:hypothetical protein AVEN_112794-1 [Araneus ventricosus]|uniref:Uncharacterized protein n=1 Tax=Araneus ventricosus TaxID=182803 RepID=A0A4Y2PQM4_ARAVE|nr:hypothetical protein AVEN_112794-1 [Araneus ventricosus]
MSILRGWFPKRFARKCFHGLVVQTLSVRYFLKAFLCKSCGNGFRNGLRGNAFADNLWKVKWQPFRNLLCYLAGHIDLAFTPRVALRGENLPMYFTQTAQCSRPATMRQPVAQIAKKACLKGFRNLVVSKGKGLSLRFP